MADKKRNDWYGLKEKVELETHDSLIDNPMVTTCMASTDGVKSLCLLIVKREHRLPCFYEARCNSRGCVTPLLCQFLRYCRSVDELLALCSSHIKVGARGLVQQLLKLYRQEW